MPGKVFLHLGLPKSGTSFLQKVLHHDGGRLREHGVIFPNGKGSLMFRAALEVTERATAWGRTPESVAGAWQQIVDAAHEHDGTTVVSNELLCLAKPAQVERMVSDLRGLEVHVVLTLRDLARQIPGEWQEGIKHGRELTLPDFLAVLFDDPSPDERWQARFWNAQDPLRVLDRWAPYVPAECVHLVINPPQGAPRTLLWERFAGVVGIPADAVAMPEQEINTSLGAAPTEVLRRLNGRLNRPGNEMVYGSVVKRIYASRLLSAHRGPRAVPPAAWHARIEERAGRLLAGLGERSHHVVGDLAELTPRLSDVVEPPVATADELLDIALDATGGLLEEIVELRATVAELRGKTARRSIGLLRPRG